MGHGLYCRQVRGLVESGWILIWVRRFLCLACGHTMSRLPDWLHPWRWYAGTVIVEALYRHCLLGEPAISIGVRFGRPEWATEWKSLRRWRKQLLVSSTLWGWMGPRLGIGKAATNRNEAGNYLERLLAEGGCLLRSSVQVLTDLSSAVRRTLRDLVYGRKKTWPMKRFLPGNSSPAGPGVIRPTFPTEKGSGPRPP